MAYIAYLDCHAGIDGNTLLAALLDVGLSLDTLKQRLASFPLPNYDISLERIANKGGRGTRATITFTAQEREIYTWSEIETLLSSVQISASIHNTTVSILRSIADARAKVGNDGTNYQAYEVTVSELIIIISIVIGLKELDITQLYVSVLPLSYSQNSTSLPIALEILRSSKAIWKPTSVAGEGVTPVGAALLATLARFDTPTMTIERVGNGYTSQAQSSENNLRLYLGMLQETELEMGGDADTDWVTVLSTNIDNMSGELLGGLMERLLTAGALDVSYTPMQMKKNRPATMLMVVCPLEKGNKLAYILLRETTTLGVRVQQVQRLKAQRTPQTIATPFGPMLIKVKRLGTQFVSAAPEYEECQRIAHEHNMSLADVYSITQKWIANTLSDEHTKSDI